MPVAMIIPEDLGLAVEGCRSRCNTCFARFHWLPASNKGSDSIWDLLLPVCLAFLSRPQSDEGRWSAIMTEEGAS